MGDYPEHEKLSKVRDKSQLIGEFLDWCEERGWQLATYTDDSTCMSPIRFAGGPRTTNDLLALFFGINLKTLEEEKDLMLDVMRGHTQ